MPCQVPDSTPRPIVGEEVRLLRQENERLRSAVETLEGLAYRDPLTGLRSRRYFEDRLQEELARQRRAPGAALSVLLIDLDGFKRINDTVGHAAGDGVLCWVAELLSLQIRFTDVCCRHGGDEFVVLLPDTTEKGCAVVVEHLRTTIADLNARGEAPVVFSVGSATSRRGDLASQLLGRADAAMYQQKRARAGAGAVDSRESQPARILRLVSNG